MYFEPSRIRTVQHVHAGLIGTKSALLDLYMFRLGRIRKMQSKDMMLHVHQSTIAMHFLYN